MGVIQSSTQNQTQLLFEKVLADALKPCSLSDAKQHISTIRQLQKEVSSDALVECLGKYHKPLDDMKLFFKTVASYATPEERSRWYTKTYAPQRSHRPTPPRPHEQPSKTPSSSAVPNELFEKLCEEQDRLGNEVKKLYRQLSESDDRLQKEVSEKTKYKDDGENIKEKLVQAKKQLQHEVAQKEKYRSDSEDFKTRLAKEMSEKISSDEKSFENITVKNRPMKIAEDYEHFCANVWLSAKETLDSTKMQSCEALSVLSQILKHAESAAATKHEELMRGIYSVVVEASKDTAPMASAAAPQRLGTVQIKKIPDGLKNAIGDFLRAAADDANIIPVVEAIRNSMMPDSTKTLTKTMSRRGRPDSMKMSTDILSDIQEYMEESARLAWKMAVQRPRMVFDAKTGVGERWKDSKQSDLYYESKDPGHPDSVVKFYVFPILKHGEAVMAKGKVYVDHKSRSPVID